MVGSTRDGVGKGLLELGRKKNVVVVDADLGSSTRINCFAKKFPDRAVQCGVAEQNMIGVAAGLAKEGKIPFTSSFAAFSPGRNWDQIRVSVCYSQLPVKIYSSHAGLTVGADGATHQALEDIALMRSLPNMAVVVPCDQEEARQATHAVASHPGPVYFRAGRAKVTDITSPVKRFRIGKARIMHSGHDVAVIACGAMVHEALKAAKILKPQGISLRVINMHTIKPLDAQIIRKAMRETRGIIVVEEHQRNGGLGDAVAGVIAKKGFGGFFEHLAVDDVFGESGTPEQLLAKHHLQARDIVKVVKQKFSSR